MSVNSLLYANRLNLNAGTITLTAIQSGGNTCAPIVCSSNVMCENLNAEIWSGKFDGTISVGDILVCGNAITKQFVRLPVGGNGTVLTVNDALPLGIHWA